MSPITEFFNNFNRLKKLKKTFGTQVVPEDYQSQLDRAMVVLLKEKVGNHCFKQTH